MKNSKKILSVLLIAVMALGMLAGCGSKKAADDSAKDAKDTLVMATNATFPPYEYVEGDDFKGIDVEIAGEIAKKLGMKLDIQDVEFDSIIAGVQSGKYDMGMAGMTVTDERKQSVDFTDPYATGIQVIIVKKGSDIKSVDDLSEDTKIGVQQGTTGHIYASDDYGEDAVTPFNKGADAVQALLSGKIDCVIIDNEPAKAYIESNDELEILDTEYVKEDYAVCVSKDNSDLRDKINTALQELKDDGTIDKIVSKYIPAE